MVCPSFKYTINNEKKYCLYHCIQQVKMEEVYIYAKRNSENSFT